LGIWGLNWLKKALLRRKNELRQLLLEHPRVLLLNLAKTHLILYLLSPKYPQNIFFAIRNLVLWLYRLLHLLNQVLLSRKKNILKIFAFTAILWRNRPLFSSKLQLFQAIVAPKFRTRWSRPTRNALLSTLKQLLLLA
jgi:hypothetical protein